MTIKEMSREFSEVEQYLMTAGKNITSLKDVPDDTVIPYDGYIIFEDEKKDGSVVEVLSVITPDKQVYSGQSATFKRSLFDILAVMGEKKFSIVKISGTTNAGRAYIDCCLDINSVEI